jgi:hypothetical protein
MAHAAVGPEAVSAEARGDASRPAPRAGTVEAVRLHCARHRVTLVARWSRNPPREARTLTAAEPGAMGACVLARNLPLGTLLAMAGGTGGESGEEVRLVRRRAPR